LLTLALLVIAVCIGMIAWGRTSHLRGFPRLAGLLRASASLVFGFFLVMMFPLCACLFVAILIALPFLLQGVFGYSDDVAVPLCLAGMLIGSIIALIAVRVIERRAGWMEQDDDFDVSTGAYQVHRDAPAEVQASDNTMKGQP
jgi:hypothetical protein